MGTIHNMDTINNSDMIHKLDHDGKEILLIGTAHVSRESTELVREPLNLKSRTRCVSSSVNPVISPSARKTNGVT